MHLANLFAFLRKSDWTDTEKVLEKLAKHVSYNVLERAVRENVDRRELFTRTAALAKIDEGVLLRKLARRLGLSYVENVAAVDLRNVGRPLKISELRRVGAMPVVAGHKIKTWVCVDPSMLPEDYYIGCSYRPYITKWSSLCKAFDESEQLSISDLTIALNKARKVLQLLKAEAVKYGATALNLNLTLEKPTYTFITKEGKRAQGVVDSSLRDGLKRIFEEGLISLKHKIELPNGEIVNLLGENNDCTISWGKRIEELPKKASVTRVDFSAEKVEEEKVEDTIEMPAKEIKVASKVVTKKVYKGDDGVLIVDDSEVFLTVMRRFLDRNGMKCHFCKSIKEAKDLLGSGFRPSVVISDYHLQNETGGDLLKALKGNEEYKDVPVIMLTSAKDIETQVELLSAGADAFVAKSEDPRVLHAHLIRLLKNQGSRREVA